MKRASLLRGLAFAAFASLGVVPWLLVAAPWLGYANGLALYALGLPLLHLALVAPSVRAGLTAAALACPLALLVALTGPSPGTAALAALVLLGVGRSLMYPRPLARTLLFESLLAAPSLLISGWMLDTSWLGVTMSTWTFWLVQSAFALLPSRGAAGTDVPGDDFQAARSELERILGDPGGSAG